MDDRYNTIETQLDTDFNAESAITAEFNTIENRFREDYTTYFDNQLPALSFEANEAGACDDDNFTRNITIIAEINCRYAKLETTRQKVKELISLVEDFFMSEQWTYHQRTKVGRSGFITEGSTSSGFRANGAVEVVVEVDTPAESYK